MLQNIRNFIVNQLDSILKATCWNNITSANILGNLGNNFAVYQRSRPLAAVLNLSNSEFSKYRSLQDIMVVDETFLVACDSEWVNIDNPDGSHKRCILSWQFAFICDDDLIEVIFLAKNLSADKPLSGRLNMLDALAVVYCLYDKHAKVMTFDVRAFRRYAVVTRDEMVRRKNFFLPAKRMLWQYLQR